MLPWLVPREEAEAAGQTEKPTARFVVPQPRTHGKVLIGFNGIAYMPSLDELREPEVPSCVDAGTAEPVRLTQFLKSQPEVRGFVEKARAAAAAPEKKGPSQKPAAVLASGWVPLAEGQGGEK